MSLSCQSASTLLHKQLTTVAWRIHMQQLTTVAWRVHMQQLIMLLEGYWLGLTIVF